MIRKTRERASDVTVFAERVLCDASAAVVTLLAALGDQLGLFKDFAARGDATSVELAQRTGIRERYAREWLAAMASAGYLGYDPSSHRFFLPSENAAVLAAENGPLFLGGLHEMIPALAGSLERLAEAFRSGAGVPSSDLPREFWEGMERFSAPWFENSLVDGWIGAMPDVERLLRAGAAVADIGCGRGRALVKLAQAYPRGRYHGFDASAPAVAMARKSAWALGIADRVFFDWRDAEEGPLGRFDIATTFGVLHDSARPLVLLREIRESLKPGGIYVCLEIRCSERLEENAGPVGALFYGLSALASTTTVLAGGGGALGAMGLPESRLRSLCRQAGFRKVRRVPIESGLHALYEIRP